MADKDAAARAADRIWSEPVPTSHQSPEDFARAVSERFAKLADKVEGLEHLLAAQALRWTAETPTTPGWYWMRRVMPNPVAQIVYVGVGDDGLYYDAKRGFGLDGLCADAGGEWAGPLEPPK